MITEEEYNFLKLLDHAVSLEISRLTNIAGILSHFPDLKVRTMEVLRLALDEMPDGVESKQSKEVPFKAYWDSDQKILYIKRNY
jgi:hypothetical protein